jgi:hypothetical protein
MAGINSDSDLDSKLGRFVKEHARTSNSTPRNSKEELCAYVMQDEFELTSYTNLMLLPF